MTIAKLSYELFETAWNRWIVVVVMDHKTIQRIALLVALLLLGSISAFAQLPVYEQGAGPFPTERPRFAAKPAPVAEKPPLVVPEVRQGLTPPVYHDPAAALRSAKMIYVKSTSLLVGVAVIEEKLQKRSEFSQLCLVLTRDVEEADLILIVEHDLFTKYTYTAIHKDTNIVVASGKLSSLGGTVAGKVAKRFLKQVVKARGSTPTPCRS